MLKLSIIVPVYNVEKYIKQCLESIFNQGLEEDSFEVIVVNDGTQDRSIDIISDLLAFHNNLRIIEQSNQGLSVARNNGLKAAKGEYVFFVDSDDVVMNNSLHSVLDMAICNAADMVVCNFLRKNDEDIESASFKISDTKSVCIWTGYEMYLNEFKPDECFIWRTLYNRVFLLNNNIRFIPQICYEDIPFTQECYLKANKCIRYDVTLYIYRMGHYSITSVMNLEKALHLNVVISEIRKLENLPNLPAVVIQRLQDNLFITFSFELWCIARNSCVYKKWQCIVADLKAREPNLWFNNGVKQFFVSVAFWFFPGIYLKIRSLI